MYTSLFIPALIIFKYVWNVIIIIQTNIPTMFDSEKGIYEEVHMHSIIINTYSIQ